VKLRVFDSIKAHNLPRLLDAGLCVTINSDDPAYFGGYVNENFLAIGEAFDLTQSEICALVRNSFEAAFVSDERRHAMMAELGAIISE